MKKMELYNVIGVDDLEGAMFASCTTLEKAKIAKKKLENEGFEDALDIVQDVLLIDAVEIDGELIEL